MGDVFGIVEFSRDNHGTVTGFTLDETRGMLRHFLATLAYRTQKALRNAPSDFGDFLAGHEVRTPKSIVQHMTSVMAFALASFKGNRHHPEPLPSLAEELERFHATLIAIAKCLERDAPFGDLTPEQLLQGPFADAMTHVGQLAMLRRLAGSPVPPEDFSQADVSPKHLGTAQEG